MILAKQVNAEKITYNLNAETGSFALIVNKVKFHIKTNEIADIGLQKEQLQKDLQYLKGFLNSVDRKLNNEKFVQNAKAEIIELERKKKADAEIRIQVIEASLSALN